MMYSYPAARAFVQPYIPDSVLHRKNIAEGTNRALKGQTNTTIFVTLDAGSATTVVDDPRISIQTCAALCPTSANAAAEVPTLWAEFVNGTMTLHHSNNAQTDRTFNVGITG